MWHGPIIRSLLDTDFYKFTMSQVFWLKHRDVEVTFGFTNRTKRVQLPATVPFHELMNELDHVRRLRLEPDEIDFLREQGMFREEYLEALRDLRLPQIDVRIVDGVYVIEATGPWWQATLWETIVLSVMNELHYRGVLRRHLKLAKDASLDDLMEQRRLEGVSRFRDKLYHLERHPGVKVIEFGTRRRYSVEHQEYVTTAFSSKWPCGLPEQILGTSNVHLAKRLGIRPIGTFAHEAPMVYAALHDFDDDALHASHDLFLRDWWEVYGEPLSIALTDTFGSEFFFRDMTPDQAAAWKGLRHDSGDPFAFGVRTIRFYEALGIDPRTKTIVFSDGLDVMKIISLYEAFHERINVAFGWGTNLTNDVGLDPLSLVMKAVAVHGRPTVKLSDNPAKATGPADLVARYQRVYGHVESAREECRY